MRTLTATLAVVSLLLLVTSCRGGAEGPPRMDSASAPANGPAPSAEESARLDAEIDRLERQVERNPADDDSRDELAAAYVSRGDARRAAQQLKEALADYRRALRFNPDNEKAMEKNAELSLAVEGTPPPGEYGEPAPLPISPNVTGDDAATPTPGKK